MTKRMHQERRAAKLAKQEQRARQLRYCDTQGGSWALDNSELAELDSLVSMIEKARAAQEQHDRRSDVQLRLARVA